MADLRKEGSTGTPQGQAPATPAGPVPELTPSIGERRVLGRLSLNAVLAILFLIAAFAFPYLPFVDNDGGIIEDATIALAYVVMALGLNIVVGYAGLLDLGYVAFFAIGAYTVGWLGSLFFSEAGGGEGISVATDIDQIGIHLTWPLIAVFAILFTAIAGMIIGLPTLRLRGDYIAIVTLAFGEIIGRIAVNGDDLRFPVRAYDATLAKLPVLPELGDATLTAGRQGITPVDKVDLSVFRLDFLDWIGDIPFLGTIYDGVLSEYPRVGDIRPWFWLAVILVGIVLFVNFRLRDSRLGRAWIALREDEVAAASMGVPLVKTKLLAYGVGAAFGGISGAFLASYLNTVNADQFEFAFSIFILAMVILGGLGSIWGCVLGAILLSFINSYLIPDVLNEVPGKIGLDFDLTQLSFGIFGFLLVVVMVLRPQGLIPERRREMEITEGIGSGTEDQLVEVKA